MKTTLCCNNCTVKALGVNSQSSNFSDAGGATPTPRAEMKTPGRRTSAPPAVSTQGHQQRALLREKSKENQLDRNGCQQHERDSDKSVFDIGQYDTQRSVKWQIIRCKQLSVCIVAHIILKIAYASSKMPVGESEGGRNPLCLGQIWWCHIWQNWLLLVSKNLPICIELWKLVGGLIFLSSSHFPLSCHCPGLTEMELKVKVCSVVDIYNHLEITKTHRRQRIPVNNCSPLKMWKFVTLSQLIWFITLNDGCFLLHLPVWAFRKGIHVVVCPHGFWTTEGLGWLKHTALTCIEV